MDWSTKQVLVTGGTGSFGKHFVRKLLESGPPRRLVVFSRDELKQHEMRVGGFDHPCLRYFIGDVRDRRRLQRAFEGIDVVVHAAALKQVPACEYNPIEAIETNVTGARNVIDAALDQGVDRVLALSTDKAVNPINLYGATKLCAEKLFVQSNAYSGGRSRFACARYGNVVGSRGSVVPLFKRQAVDGRITVTDERMTRFWITLAAGARFVKECVEDMRGGEVYVPKIPSMSIMDLARALAPEAQVEVIGIRPGEKLHEVLVSAEEARHTLDAGDRFIIQPVHPWWKVDGDRGAELPDDFSYTSDTNDHWLDIEAIQRMADGAPA